MVLDNALKLRDIAKYITESDFEKLPLDNVDFEILCGLDENAKISNTSLAKSIGTSEATVRRRIQDLENKGVIKGYGAFIDYSFLNLCIKVFLLIKIVDNGDKKTCMDKLAENLTDHKRVVSLYRVSGKYDMHCELLFSGLTEITDFLDNELENEYIESKDVQVVMSAYKVSPWSGV